MVRIAVAAMACLTTLGMALKAPLHGFAVEEIVWAVDVWGNGTKVNITGPVRNVYNTLFQLNPDLVKDADQTAWDISCPQLDTLTTNRADFGPVCGENGEGWLPAGAFGIEEGIEYLCEVPGEPVNKPGPRACGRVRFSWKSAIWWCNGKTIEAKLPSFNTIADRAQVLDWECYYSAFKCLGQNFNAGNWTCIVRHDDDNC